MCGEFAHCNRSQWSSLKFMYYLTPTCFENKKVCGTTLSIMKQAVIPTKKAKLLEEPEKRYQELFPAKRRRLDRALSNKPNNKQQLCPSNSFDGPTKIRFKTQTRPLLNFYLPHDKRRWTMDATPQQITILTSKRLYDIVSNKAPGIDKLGHCMFFFQDLAWLSLSHFKK